MFFWPLACMFMVTQGVVSAFPSERGMFWREQANKTYNPIAWYFAKLLSEVPMYSAFVTIVSVITYFIVELSTEKGH
jgi:ABC-type multidrug transport system permease subunit